MASTGIERGDQVRVACPACAPESEQVHEVLKPDGHATVRCRACDHVHKVSIDAPSTDQIRVVVSSGGESLRTTAEVPVDEQLGVGEEFVAETADGPMGVRITSLELADGERRDHAEAGSVETIWTRAVDNVGVPTTIHPADGRREATVSETYYLPGDEELVVGEAMPLSDGDVEIERIMLRDDVVGGTDGAIDRPGASAPAKDVKRVFGRGAREDQWTSPWG